MISREATERFPEVDGGTDRAHGHPHARSNFVKKPTVYRFGRFVLDTHLHALIKEGTRQALQEQPFQVLLALLETPNQIVTREALRLRLWGTNTFVDFDQSLNSAVRRLRLALEDNPREPTCIETIPRVGFRLLLPVSHELGTPMMAPARKQATPALTTSAA